MDTNVVIYFQDKEDKTQIQGLQELLHPTDKNNDNNYSVTLVHERTIPNEQPPILGEVSANFFHDRRMEGGQRGGSPRPYSRFSRPEPLLLLPSSPSVVLTRLSGPRSRPTTSQKIW
jgi:hypothetical protein